MTRAHASAALLATALMGCAPERVTDGPPAATVPSAPVARPGVAWGRVDRVLQRELARRPADEKVPVAVWVGDAGTDDAAARRHKVRGELEALGIHVETEVDEAPIVLVRASRGEVDSILALPGVSGLFLYEIDRG